MFNAEPSATTEYSIAFTAAVAFCLGKTTRIYRSDVQECALNVTKKKKKRKKEVKCVLLLLLLRGLRARARACVCVRHFDYQE